MGQPETSTSDNTTSQPDTSNSNNTASKPVTAEYSGYSFSHNARTGQPANSSNTIEISSNSIDTIVINGKSYSLVPEMPGISGGTVTVSTIWQEDNTKVVCCGTRTDIKAVKIGAVLNGETAYIFAQGKPTPEDQIPTSGQVVYEGNGTAKLISLAYQDDRKGFQKSSLSTHIDVDFDNKNVSGYLYDGDKKFFDITNGKINGNNITDGKVSLAVQNEENRQAFNIDNNAQFSAPLNAKFYGENAKEVAGTAHNEKWGVIFAASKAE
ncbi:transferrin-binding protein-like solute binding protein [Gallibacterium anatis]|uniref:transferrin-binding protein-like solute binding protein n=1 Tax=Gallibacterium anatis TaxID=750 RepID=UPI0039FB9B30